MLFIRAWISGKEPYTFVKELNIEKELCSYVGNESCLFVVNSLGGVGEAAGRRLEKDNIWDSMHLQGYLTSGGVMRNSYPMVYT